MISDFEFLPEVESGGLGFVHKARHKQFGYYRAIKQIKAQGDDNARRDFERECEKLKLLSNGQHPNIVQTYGGFQEEGGRAYLEMDWIDGKTLEDYCNESGFIPIDEILRFVQNTASALAYCHQKGIIHNDLHSNNIMRRDSDGVYILLDFGLAMENGEVIRTSKLDRGCPEFMSPERVNIELLLLPSLQSAKPEELSRTMLEELRKATPQWDIYSLGCLIFKALTREAPFYRLNKSEEEYKKVLKQHLEKEPECKRRIYENRRRAFQKTHPDLDFSSETCPDWLVDMVAKCLCKDKEHRYPNAQAFLDEFQKYLHNSNWNLEEENTGLRYRLQKVEAENIELNKDIAHLRALRKPIRINIWWKWATTIVVCLALFSNVIAIYYSVMMPARIIAISIFSALTLIAICVYETIWPKRDTNEQDNNQ